MDPSKEPAPMTNAAKAEHDSEINRNLRGIPIEAQEGQGDMDVIFVTRPQNPWQNTSYLQRQREPRPLYLDSRPGRSNEPGPECLNSPVSSQSSSNTKLNDCTAAGSSKSINIDNGLDPNLPTSMYKLEVDGLNCSNRQSGSQSSDVDNVRESRKRPSSLKLNRPNMDEDSSSLSDYSLGSEDGCIYTYRGGEHLADLPSSFFSLDMGLPADRLALPNYVAPQAAGNAREGSRASSPDMDFLEMDFDPGPSNEVDSGEESTPDPDLDVMEMPEEHEPVRGPSPEKPCSSGPVTISRAVNCNSEMNRPSTSQISSNAKSGTSRGLSVSHNREHSVPHIVYGPYITHVNARGDSILVRRTMSHWVAPVGVHTFGGELIPRLPPDTSENQDFQYTNLQSHQSNAPDFNALVPAAVFHTMKAKTLIDEKKTQKDTITTDALSEPIPSTSTASTSCVEPPRSMIWSEEAACERQVTQIGTSACGATAVVNVFNALEVPFDIERINISVGTRLRANNASIPRYLLSRAVAGCTAADIINGIQIASGGLVTARFFPTYPERAFSLSHFLADWISLGAVPILTLNLQKGCDPPPDAWHHQMVFGVSPQGVYLCNPLECVRENVLWTRLVSPSVLLVRAKDVVARFGPDADLTPLMHVPDARFHAFNVFGQVANVIRESRLPWRQDSNPRSSHVRLPAAYQAGVTVAALTGSEAHRRLMLAPPLPLLDNRYSRSPQNDPA